MKTRQKAMEIAYKADIPSAIILGVVVAASELPCSGSVYIGILTYLKVKETLLNGIFYLTVYNLLFVLPLVIIFLFASNKVVTEKLINLQEQMGRKMHLILAAVMILMGLAILIFFL